MSVSLIFGADNLQQPLTGIGRYSLELARRLQASPAISSIRYFSLGRWIDDPLTKLLSPAESESVNADVSLKAWLASHRFAVKAYNTLSPSVFAWRLRKLTSCDVYHSPSFFVPRCKARKVATVHDLSHEINPEFHPAARIELMSKALPRSIAAADHIITVSETVRQELVERYGIQPSSISAILLAADAIYRPHTPAMLISPMAALGLRAGQYSLFVGTVEPRKNVKRLLEAYASLPASLRSEFPLVIAGGQGWNSAEAHALIAESVRAGWLHYLSYVDQRLLPALYAGARLMVYPSIYEGFGLPIVEAMASGTPVLTSNISCMPEVAAGAARLINPLDTEEISHGINQCLTDVTWQADARAKGLVRARQLSWDRCAAETIDVYKQLL